MGDTFIISGLKAKRAELSGLIADYEKRIGQARADLVHVDAVLRMFAPEVEPDAIKPKKAVQRNGWFSVGECYRLALDTLRTAPRPMPTREVTERLMLVKGLDPADARTRELVQKTVIGTLNRASDVLERVVGNEVVAWRVKG